MRSSPAPPNTPTKLWSLQIFVSLHTRATDFLLKLIILTNLDRVALRDLSYF